MIALFRSITHVCWFISMLNKTVFIIMAYYIDNYMYYLIISDKDHTMENKILCVELSVHRYIDDVIRCLKSTVNNQASLNCLYMIMSKLIIHYMVKYK